MRIGILGGTFDPPHLGHLEFARAALDELRLDEVLFLPAHRNPLKKARGSPAKQRLEMVRLMVANEPKMAVSDIEITRGGPSYTVDTLFELQTVKPGDYWLLVGSDALKSFEEWKSPQKILKLCRLGVAQRPSTVEAEVLSRLHHDIRDHIDIVPLPPIAISSTDLRERLTTGHGIVTPYLLPGVLQYIKQNRLYVK